MKVLQDSAANSGRPHIQVLLIFFRTSQILRRSERWVNRTVLGMAVSAVYRSLGLFVFGIDIPVSTRIGPGLAIHHGMGLVVHNGTIIGSDVTLRHNTTVGSKKNGRAPQIGDRVDIGPNSCVIGEVMIGDDSRIGAGSVVVRDVASSETVAGNPARSLQSRNL